MKKIETPVAEKTGLINAGRQAQLSTTMHPMKRIGKAEEITAARLKFDAPGIAFVTGYAPAVDGTRLI